MRQTVDGFPIENTINFLPNKPDPSLNEWSYGKTVKIAVLDFWFNMRWVHWKGEAIYVEFDLFKMMIRDWVRGCTEAESKMGGIHKRDPMTKEEALDLAFEMSHFGGDPPKRVKEKIS